MVVCTKITPKRHTLEVSLINEAYAVEITSLEIQNGREKENAGFFFDSEGIILQMEPDRLSSLTLLMLYPGDKNGPASPDGCPMICMALRMHFAEKDYHK